MIQTQVWNAGSQATLCNVWWPANYSDIINWGQSGQPNVTVRDDYFLALTTTSTLKTTGMTLLRQGDPVDLPITFDTAKRFNYLWVENNNGVSVEDNYGGEAQKYFYFVTAVEYLAPAVTRCHVQLDVWTTYSQMVVFGSSFVEQGHIAISNQNDNGSTASLRRYHAIDDGLDCGDKMDLVLQGWFPISHEDDGVLFTSTVDLVADPGNVDQPKLKTAPGGETDNLPSAVGNYWMYLQDFKDMISGMSDYPWISRNIQSVQIVPRNRITVDDVTFTCNSLYGAKQVFVATGGSNAVEGSVNVFQATSIGLTGQPARYQKLNRLKTFPYSLITLTNMQGEATQFKPQYFYDNTTSLLSVSMATPPNVATLFYFDGYGSSFNAGTGSDVWNIPDFYGEAISSSLGVTHYPQTAVLIDGGTLALSDSAYARSYSYRDASWSQDKATRGIDLSRRQANQQISTANASNRVQNRLIDDTRIVNAIGAGANTLMQIGGGNVVGALGSVVSAGTNIVNSMAQQDAMNHQLAISNNQINQATDMNNVVASTNTAGDYQMAIAAIQAGVQQAEASPPSIAGLAAATTMVFAKHIAGCFLQYHFIQPNVLARIGDFMLRWGCKINEYIEGQALAVMSKFSYWKMGQTVITSSAIPETEKAVIRGIFENGVTVWNSPNSFGVADLDGNVPIGGAY